MASRGSCDPFAAYLREIRIDPRPAGRAAPRRGGGLPWLRHLVVSAAIIAGLAYLAAGRNGGGDPSPAGLPDPSAATAPPPVRVAIADPAALYAVRSAELEGLPLVLEARRHASGGREDILVFGAFEGDETHLHLSLDRTGAGLAAPASFFVDLVRRAAQAGYAVVRSAQASGLATKFGAVEAADVALEGGSERPCLAFRSSAAAAAAGLRLSGWLCGPAARPADRQQLGCLIDAITLVTAADPTLTAIFAAAEPRRREGCSAPGSGASGRRTSWLDARPDRPPLRGAPPAR